MCPWYEELEPVLRDRPMARPMGSQDSLGNKEVDIDILTPNLPSQESQFAYDNDTEAIEGWFPTPPKNRETEVQDETDTWLDPNLKSSRASPAETSWEDVSSSLPRRQ